MATSLTINLDENVLARAEAYAQAHGSSLPALITDYLKLLDAPAHPAAVPAIEVSPDILALQGSVQLPAGTDWQEARLTHLRQKYEL